MPRKLWNFGRKFCDKRAGCDGTIVALPPLSGGSSDDQRWETNGLFQRWNWAPVGKQMRRKRNFTFQRTEQGGRRSRYFRADAYKDYYALKKGESRLSGFGRLPMITAKASRRYEKIKEKLLFFLGQEKGCKWGIGKYRIAFANLEAGKGAWVRDDKIIWKSTWDIPRTWSVSSRRST